MELSLSPEDVGLLRRVVANHLSELRSEIVHTERYGLRQELKEDEARLKALFARLESLQPATDSTDRAAPG